MKNIGLPHVNLDKLNKLVALTAAIFLLLQLFLPIAVSAAALTTRKLTLGSSAVTTRTTHTFNFTTATTASIGSMSFDYCTTASSTCTAPTGFDSQEASLVIGTQVGATGFTVHANTDVNTIVITRTAASLSSGTAVTMPFGTGTGSSDGPTNPTTADTTFFARISSFTSIDGTGTATDTGVVAASVADQISVTASVDETLTFCIYTGANCAAGGATVALGTLSASAHGTGTNKMDAATNANSGYVITYSGGALAGPNQNIVSNTGSSQVAGTEEFGINLKDNGPAADPDVGAEASGGSGTASAGYNTANSFKYNSGDQVASAASTTLTTTYTVSYVADISAVTKPGAYSTTVTYVATATF